MLWRKNVYEKGRYQLGKAVEAGETFSIHRNRLRQPADEKGAHPFLLCQTSMVSLPSSNVSHSIWHFLSKEQGIFKTHESNIEQHRCQ